MSMENPVTSKRPKLIAGHVDEKERTTNKESKEHQDQEYFRSYADVSVHEEMLSDAVRTNAYRYAILKNYEKIRGMVVADVGAGTGILSMFCVKAGAKKVYAVEASSLAEQTRSIIKENKMLNRIDVIQNKVEDVNFPEMVDVVVSEWMGYTLLYESMLQSVIKTRDKWLKKGGLMFPEKATLYIAAFSDDDFEERLAMWENIQSMYKVSMATMKEYAQKSISNNVHVKCLPPEGIMSHGFPVCCLDLYTVTVEQLQEIKCDFKLNCFGHSRIHGFVTWFTVGFPGDITLSTSPYTEETHWGQTLMYVDTPFDVKQDTEIGGSLSLKPHKDKSRFLDLNLSYSVDGGSSVSKYYFMNDCIS